MRVHIKTYGCQMNGSDSEVIAGIMRDNGIEVVDDELSADALLLNGCAIRENAEERVMQHLGPIMARKRENPGLVVGVTGCMGAHLGQKVQEKRPGVDFVIGPDSYRDLPALLRRVVVPEDDRQRYNEDYDDVEPVRKRGISAWVAISRGCDEACAYCIVPKTRGHERSRPADSLVREVEQLVDQGFLEATLIGQNVNAYQHGDVDFAGLLDRVSRVPGLLRLRYATSHPMNMSEALLRVMAERDNICEHIHLPVQSGSDPVLQRMRRRYTRDQYFHLVDTARRYMPEVSLTTDIISGFCGETAADHQQTLALVKQVRFDSAYTFYYSPREGTDAYRDVDDIPFDVKKARLQEILDVQRRISEEKNAAMIGREVEILIEGPSRRSPDDSVGRARSNKKIIVRAARYEPGTLLNVTIRGATSQTFIAAPVKAPACA